MRESVIAKMRAGGFIGILLGYLLRPHGIPTFIHPGLATEAGILPTARHAVNLGFCVVVPRDRVGPMNKEHHAEAMSLPSRLTMVPYASEIAAAWAECPLTRRLARRRRSAVVSAGGPVPCAATPCGMATSPPRPGEPRQ